ncbi:hypothetical protein DK842_01355 [Chromobacterium phragmitis]|nr:hypothetical protein DK842_01355 [Chromobacterium phragmitis]
MRNSGGEKSYPSDISREQFEAIKPLLESARKKTSPRRVDLYDVFCPVLYLLRPNDAVLKPHLATPASSHQHIQAASCGIRHDPLQAYRYKFWSPAGGSPPRRTPDITMMTATRRNARLCRDSALRQAVL